ncbi:MAG TPA: histidine kinase [Pseudonocardiaceae bacterium]
MRRLSLWMRAHPMFGDTIIAVCLGFFDLLSGISSDPWTENNLQWYVLAGAFLLIPIIFRRKYPELASYLIMFGAWIQVFTHGSATAHPNLLIRGGDLAIGVALYTMVTCTNRRRSLEYAGLLVIGTTIWGFWRVGGGSSQIAFVLFGAGVVYGFCWVLGEFIGARRAYHAELESRLRLLETERGQQARIAVVEERARIARELHDVVAHAVSVIVVQADGAAYAIHDNPDLAETAVHTIAETGRGALHELRRLLELLRNESDQPDTRTPQPGVSALPELAEKVTSVGLPVWLVFRGDLAGLPATVGLGVYRIVQEALTNTLKHAGIGAEAHVRVERVGGLIEVEILDGGPEPRTDDDGGAAFPRAREVIGVSGGNGLIGMRERATVLGGTLSAGPRPGGGWQVRATFPVQGAKTPALP